MIDIFTKYTIIYSIKSTITKNNSLKKYFYHFGTCLRYFVSDCVSDFLIFDEFACYLSINIKCIKINITHILKMILKYGQNKRINRFPRFILFNFDQTQIDVYQFKVNFFKIYDLYKVISIISNLLL